MGEAAEAAARLANALARWAEDIPARADGRAAVLDTWASRRRRRMCLYAFERVVGTNDATAGGSEGAGAGAASNARARGGSSRAHARGRAVTRQPGARGGGRRGRGGGVGGRAGGRGWGGRGAPSGEAGYERCFFLYGTLMFFVFRVRVRNRRRGRGPGFGNAPFP